MIELSRCRIVCKVLEMNDYLPRIQGSQRLTSQVPKDLKAADNPKREGSAREGGGRREGVDAG